MIKFEILTAIDDKVFAGLYAQSKTQFDAHYPWHYWPGITSDEDREAHVRSAYDNILSKGGVVWLIRDDGTPVALNAGSRSDDGFVWRIGVAGDNTAGSRSWMYDPTYTDARNAMWNKLGINGWFIELGEPDAPILAHVLNKKDTSDVGGAVDTEDPKRIKITRPKA